MTRKNHMVTSLLGMAALLGAAPSAFAATAPPLGTSAKFAVLSAAPSFRGAVTCTDGSTRCALRGTVTAPVSAMVLADFNRGYTALQAKTCQRILTGTLAGVSLPPGVYCFDAAASLTGTLTLNGPSTGIWIFLVNGDLTGNSFSTVMAGSGLPCNVYWGSSGATTMTTSNLKGTVLAGQAITLTGGSFIGRAMAKRAVTMTTLAATGCGLAL